MISRASGSSLLSLRWPCPVPVNCLHFTDVSAADSPGWHVHSDCPAKQGKRWGAQSRESGGGINDDTYGDRDWCGQPDFLIISDLRQIVKLYQWILGWTQGRETGNKIWLEEKIAGSAHFCLTIAPLHNHSVEKHSKNDHHHTWTSISRTLGWGKYFVLTYYYYLHHMLCLWRDPEQMLRIIIRGSRRLVCGVLYSQSCIQTDNSAD